jgi:hypothetical protein
MHTPDFFRKIEGTTLQLLLRTRLPNLSCVCCKALSGLAWALSRLFRPPAALVGDPVVATTTGSAGTYAPGGANVKRGGRASSEFGGTATVGLETCGEAECGCDKREVPWDVG